MKQPLIEIKEILSMGGQNVCFLIKVSLFTPLMDQKSWHAETTKMLVF